MNSAWQDVETTSSFPVVSGTVLEVTCSEVGTENTGSKHVTCQSGTDFTSIISPKCETLRKQTNTDLLDKYAAHLAMLKSPVFPILSIQRINFAKLAKVISNLGCFICDIRYHISGCTGLDPAWKNVQTSVSFPVDYGTVLDVKCNEEVSVKAGGSEVTCQSGTDYTYVGKPSCINIGK